jgi:hypothetical protein
MELPWGANPCRRAKRFNGLCANFKRAKAFERTYGSSGR